MDITIEIIEKKDQNLYVYQNENLLFYSKLKWNWLKRNVVTIFDEKNDLVIEFQSYTSFFITKFKILKQDNDKTYKISKINDAYINYGKNINLKKETDNHFSFNLNFSYFYKKRKVAEVKQKLYSFPQKIHINIEEKNIEFRNLVIVHIFAIRTGYSSD